MKRFLRLASWLRRACVLCRCSSCRRVVFMWAEFILSPCNNLNFDIRAPLVEMSLALLCVCVQTEHSSGSVELNAVNLFVKDKEKRQIRELTWKLQLSIYKYKHGKYRVLKWANKTSIISSTISCGHNGKLHNKTDCFVIYLDSDFNQNEWECSSCVFGIRTN